MMRTKLILMFLFSLFWINSTFAADKTPVLKTPQLSAMSQQIAVDAAHNKLLADKLRILHQNNNQKIQLQVVDAATLQRAEAAVALAQADVDGITVTLNVARSALTLTQDNIQSLQNRIENNSTMNGIDKSSIIRQNRLQDQYGEQQALLGLQQERLKTLQQTANLAQEILQMVQTWQLRIQTNYVLQQQAARQKAMDQLAANLQVKQKQWSAQLLQLNQQLHATNVQGLVNSPFYAQLEMDIFNAEEQSNLVQVQLNVASMNNRLEDLVFTPAQTHSLNTLTSAQRQANLLSNRLSQMQIMLANKVDLLQHRVDLTNKSMQQGMLSASDGQDNLVALSNLMAAYQDQQKAADELTQKIQVAQGDITKKLTEQLASRQSLPGFDPTAWLQLGNKLLQIPPMTIDLVRSWYNPIVDAVNKAANWQWGLIALAVVVWSILWVKLHYYLFLGIKRLSQDPERFFTKNALLISLQLLQRHLAPLMLLGAFVGLLLLFDLPIVFFMLLIKLAITAIIFSLLLGFSHLLLLETEGEKAKEDIRFYSRLRWTLLVGGVVTLLSVLVHQLPLNYDVQDIFGRLFMLFLLVVALVVFRVWVRLPELIGPKLNNDGHYLNKVVRWLSLLIPLALFSNSIIGLIGYVEFSFTIAAYQGVFLMVLTGYMVASGLLDEVMRLSAASLIQRLRNGWLWSEAFLKPFHWILRFSLFFYAVAILFKLYGWGRYSWAAEAFDHLLTTKLVAFAGSEITVFNVIEFFISIAVLIWIARWTREFAYRWLYSNVKDLGLRNSLSLLTQYAMVMIGILIALKIMGINLTALTFIASAFGLGIGLGLRDLANNYVSGILLLLERPVRVGDYITVNNTDGVVTYIGMRSVTVLTDDNQEMLVPNSMVFSQVFTNWTHQNSVVRTMVFLKASREDDPHRLRELIYQVLKTVPEVLTNPAPIVYLKDMEDVLLKFQIEYHTDMQAGPSRTKIRSKVLLAMYDRFKAEGIHPPESPHEIIIQGSLPLNPA